MEENRQEQAQEQAQEPAKPQEQQTYPFLVG